MRRSISDDPSNSSRQKQLTEHLVAALDIAENDNLRYHIRQALQHAECTDSET